MKKTIIIFLLSLIFLAAPFSTLLLAAEVRLTNNTYPQVGPVIDGDTVAWIDWRYIAGVQTTAWIYTMDINGGSEVKRANTYAGSQTDHIAPGDLAISGNVIVWEDYRKWSASADADIYMMNLTNGVETPVANNSSSQYNPDISGNRVVWQDNRNGSWDIYMKDISTGVETRITDDPASQLDPSISGDKIVWADNRNGAYNYDVYMYNISTGVTSQITTDFNRQQEVDISGDKIAWLDYRNNVLAPNVYYYDLANPVPNGVRLSTVNSDNPRLEGNRIVWTQWASTNWDIYAYDTSNSRKIRITTDGADQIYPDIYGNTAVWQDKRNTNNWEIYAFKGLVFPPPPTSFIASTDADGYVNSTNIGLTWSAVDPPPSDGINNYDLDYQFQGGPWTNWKTDTALTTDIFNAANGEGSYRFRVRAEDTVGNLGNYDGSATVVLDLTQPTDPSSFTSPQPTNTWLGINQLTLNWSGDAFDALSGVDGYSIDWDNSAAPANPPVKNVNYGTTTSISPALADNANWYAHLRTVDKAGNWTSTKNLGPFKVDVSAPTKPATVTDDGVYTSDLTQLSASWSASSDAQSGVAAYEYSIGTSAGATDLIGWIDNGTAVSVVKSGLSLTNGATYFINVRARNGAGIFSAVTSSDGITVDNTPPSAPASVSDGGQFTNNATQLSANWGAASDGQSGIASYEYSIGTGPGLTNIVNWTNVGAATSVVRSGLSLIPGATYYINVWAKNGVGMTGGANNSDGITVDTTPPTNPTPPALELNGVKNDTWQNSTSSPSFTWTGAGDGGGSQVAGYYYYFGTSSVGTNTATTPVAALSPGSMPAGTYYLRVRAFDGAGNSAASWVTLFIFKYQIPGFTKNDAWFSGGANTWPTAQTKLVSGDFNGDLRTDVATFFNYPAARQVKIFVFKGNAAGGFDPPVQWYDTGPGNWDWDGSMLTSGDYDGDGKDDIGVLYGYAVQRDVKIFVFSGNAGGTAFNPPKDWWQAGPGNWDWDGSKLVSGDFNNDGKTDMAILYGYKVQRDVRIFVFPSNGISFSYPGGGSKEWWHAGPNNWDWDGSMLTGGDYTGDGKDDLGILYGYAVERDVRAFVFPSTGTNFSASNVWWQAGAGNWDWAGTKLVSGDYDSDGRDDLGAFYGYGGAQSRIFVLAASGNNNFNPPSMWWDSGPGGWDWSGTFVDSGDYDGDGRGEMVGLYDLGSSSAKLTIFR